MRAVELIKQRSHTEAKKDEEIYSLFPLAGNVQPVGVSASV